MHHVNKDGDGDQGDLVLHHNLKSIEQPLVGVGPFTQLLNRTTQEFSLDIRNRDKTSYWIYLCDHKFDSLGNVDFVVIGAAKACGPEA